MNRALSIAAGAVIGVAGALLMGQCERRKTSEELGAAKADAARLRADSVAKAGEITRVDSVFVVDTQRVTRTVDRFRTRVDSLRVTDTLTVREQVLVAAADTVIQACRVALTSCDARVAARDSLLAVVAQQRTADQRIAAARLRLANPRILPYGEALIDPLDSRTVVARGAVEMRLLGPIRLVAGLQYTTLAPHPLRALVGVRVTF